MYLKYIALLRGINVGGKKSIKMTDLNTLFQALGFNNVKTYIQSGNVVFDYETTDTTKIADKIKLKINETFCYEVETIIRTEEELINIINNNPFIKEDNIEVDKLYVTLLSNLPQQTLLDSLELKKEEDEKFAILGRTIYLYCPNGYGNTKLNNTMFEKKLKTVATTRNLKTINKLLEMVKSFKE